jgi:uncharacterized membrane protein YhhN
MPAIALIAFALCAVTDWVAVAAGARRLEYAAKPAALAVLLLWAAAGAAPSAWLLAALACSLLGDVFLMLPAGVFLPGVAAFFLAHVAYVGAFDAPAPLRLVWLVVTLGATLPFARRILAAITRPGVRAAVAVYMLAIGLMAASAIASGRPLAAAGAVLFLSSDLLLAWNRFVRPVAHARPVIMATYHLGQLALAAALRGG